MGALVGTDVAANVAVLDLPHGVDDLIEWIGDGSRGQDHRRQPEQQGGQRYDQDRHIQRRGLFNDPPVGPQHDEGPDDPDGQGAAQEPEQDQPGEHAGDRQSRLAAPGGHPHDGPQGALRQQHAVARGGGSPQHHTEQNRQQDLGAVRVVEQHQDCPGCGPGSDQDQRLATTEPQRGFSLRLGGRVPRDEPLQGGGQGQCSGNRDADDPQHHQDRHHRQVSLGEVDVGVTAQWDQDRRCINDGDEVGQGEVERVLQ